MLVFGARRLRATRLAGLEQGPAIIDTTTSPDEQVVENAQREPLTWFELARFVGRRLEAGDSQAAIARQIGKTASFVNEVASLVHAPAAADSSRSLPAARPWC